MDNHSIPSSRPSSDSYAPPAISQGPIPLFDLHLKFVADSYISFFQERKRIEEAYVDSLLRLHRKSRSIDAFLDDRSPNSPVSPHSNSPYHDQITTARSAWAEARDSIEREAQTRNAFLNTLTIDCLNPLIALRESQERTRKRIKEDFKDSSVKYQEYAENVLPKLRGKYSKRFAEVEDIRGVPDGRRNMNAQPQGGSSHSNPYSNLSAVPTTAPAHNTSFPISPTSSLPTSSANRPSVTSPQPLRALDRRPSGSTRPNPGGPRNRSPSTSTPFAELAQQGKKQLGHLITFLDRDKVKASKQNEDVNLREQFKDTLKDGLTAVRSMNVSSEAQALKMVRAKRDLDEADKEYRKGVHWMETLRLRKTKIIEAGFMSLTMFVEEEAQVVKNILGRYADNVIATTMTQTQLYTHLRAIVDKISPETDVKRVSARIPPLDAIVPEPLLYEHGQVGECRDLLFGFSLADYATAKGLRDGEIPKIVKMCIDEVDQRGLDMEGIYRVSGRLAVVKNLQQAIEKDEAAFDFSKRNPRDDVYAVASLLKLYLRELPEPLFKFPLQDRIHHTEALAAHKSNNFPLLRSKLRRLPPIHQATLKALIEHLARVAAREEKNKMGKKNLAILFGAVVFGEDDNMGMGDNGRDGDGQTPPMDSKAMGQMLLDISSWKDTLMEDMIAHAHILFSDDHTQPRTPRSEPAALLAPPYPPGTSTPSQELDTLDLPNPYPSPLLINSPPPHVDNGSPSSPPLPPTPAGEPAPIAYGSKTTRVLSHLPNSTPHRSHRKTASTSSAHVEDHSTPHRPSTPQRLNASASGNEDFTPKVPSKPAGSIHPSARSNRGESNSSTNDPPPPLLPPRPPQLHGHSRNPSTQSQKPASSSLFVPPPPPPPLLAPVASTITTSASSSSTISPSSVMFPSTGELGRESPPPVLPPRPAGLPRSVDDPIRKHTQMPAAPETQLAGSRPSPLPITPMSDHHPDLPPERSPSADSEGSWTSAMDTVSALDDDMYIDAPPPKK